MMNDRASRIAFAASLLLHAVLFAPVRGFLPLPEGSAEVAPADREEPMVFRFADRQPEPAETSEPSELLSTTDARAAQPEAPEEVPEGAAYAAGAAPVPVSPRASGVEDPGAESRRRETPAEEPAPEDERRPAPDREEAPATTARTDPRLAMPMSSPRLRSGAPERPGTDRPPVPEVDQRLTRAEAGSAFSLNTTAWRWGPYMERLKRAVEEHIAPPAAFYYGTAAWITRVRFRIAPDGTLTDVRLLDHRGVDDLQYVAMDAIADAAEYEPLPTDFPEPYLEITANFYFNVTREH